MITHRNYISNTEQVIANGKLDPDYDNLINSARWLCFLPMYHAYGQTYYCVGSVRRGVPVYVMQKFDFEKMLEYIQAYKITDLTLVPPIAVALAKRPIVKQYDLSSVKHVGCGAAPLGREVSVEVESLWPDHRVNVKQVGLANIESRHSLT